MEHLPLYKNNIMTHNVEYYIGLTSRNQTCIHCDCGWLEWWGCGHHVMPLACHPMARRAGASGCSRFRLTGDVLRVGGCVPGHLWQLQGMVEPWILPLILIKGMLISHSSQWPDLLVYLLPPVTKLWWYYHISTKCVNNDTILPLTFAVFGICCFLTARDTVLSFCRSVCLSRLQLPDSG